MKRTFKVALAGACAAFACSVHADLRDQLDVNIGVAELVVPGAQPNEVAEKVRGALAQFSIPASLNHRAVGAETPVRPGAPRRTQEMFRGAPVAVYVCDGGYAEVVKRPPPVQNAFAFIAEQTQACLYSFRGGVKAYLVFSRGVRTESLTGGIFKGITRAIQGTEDERIAKELQWGIDEIRKVLPEVLVERIDIPGRPAVEPDKVAVSRIIPAAPPEPATAVAPVVAAAPSSSSQQAKVAARKDLTGMGLVFHSQEQFFQSIRRKDDVAVSLFLAGGGVNPMTADASGVSALALAESIGAREIVALLKSQVGAETRPVVSAQATASGTGAVSEVAVITIPADMKAKLDEQIDSMNLSPAEKEVARVNAYRNAQSVLRSVERLKSMAQGQ